MDYHLSTRFQVAPSATVEKDASFGLPSSSLWFALGGYPSNTGVPVTPISALQSVAVYACTKVLSEDLAKLPIKVRRKLARGGWRDAPDHPVARLLRRPNGWLTPFESVAFTVVSFCLRGNGYLAAFRDRDGNPRYLIPILPDRCAVLLSERGTIYYRASHALFNEPLVFSTEDMIHVRNMGLDGGILGMSPVACAQDSLGLALAAQKNAATLFRQGSLLGGVLETPGKLSREAATRMAESWTQAYSGSDNAHRIAVLEEGVKFNAISMSAEDAQLLESRKYSAEEVARLFRVPPHKIGILDRATFSNIENQNQSYIDDALMGIARRFEEAAERVLFFDDERDRFCIRFDFDSMLRGDLKTRAEAYQTLLLNGVLSVNEVREREGLPPVEGGDEHRFPLNTAVAGDKPGAPKVESPHEEEPSPAADTDDADAG